ncbi:MAG: hypothetical protein IH932_01170 [Thaumarchaeota archaeon]|nr:hypothetical protein [Nitrososphaerota archaeon]
MTGDDHIFKDREKISHRFIPSNLPHREEQINSLKSLFFKSLENPSNAHLQIAQIIGDVGSGKTVTSLHFGEMLELEAHSPARRSPQVARLLEESLDAADAGG